jgi:hypothetical protein
MRLVLNLTIRYPIFCMKIGVLSNWMIPTIKIEFLFQEKAIVYKLSCLLLVKETFVLIILIISLILSFTFSQIVLLILGTKSIKLKLCIFSWPSVYLFWRWNKHQHVYRKVTIYDIQNILAKSFFEIGF